MVRDGRRVRDTVGVGVGIRVNGGVRVRVRVRVRIRVRAERQSLRVLNSSFNRRPEPSKCLG